MTTDTTTNKPALRQLPKIVLTREERMKFLDEAMERGSKQFSEQFRLEGLARYREQLEAKKRKKTMRRRQRSDIQSRNR
ncbi:MAG: hypothetical protein FWE67_03460 [Planctomycetaceae bacterium]|nr:hypothetical protein [Planctomycetaceae bacterium]